MQVSVVALNESEFIEIEGDRYRLGRRRSIEMGSVSEELFTGDLSLPSTEVKSKEIDVDRGDDSDTISPEVSHKLALLDHTNQADDWIIEFIALGTVIKIRPNPRRDDVYEKHYAQATEFDEKIDIGRASDNDLELIDPSVSRYHARLFYSSGTWTIEDFNPANGTLLNGIAISKVESLSTGDVISIGELKLVFR